MKDYKKENEQLKEAFWALLEGKGLTDFAEKMILEYGCQGDNTDSSFFEGQCPYKFFDDCEECPIIYKRREQQLTRKHKLNRLKVKLAEHKQMVIDEIARQGLCEITSEYVNKGIQLKQQIRQLEETIK